jgi:gamma-glutamylcyclotransferase
MSENRRFCLARKAKVKMPVAENENPALTWYLGFGSNMNRSIFEGRRSIRPLQALPALLENYRLCFNLAVGPGERGVANLVSEPGAQTWGVLYLITTEQAERLDRTESVHRGVYRRLPISVTVASGEQIGAFTYQSERISQGRKPSQRYLGLLIEGALQHGLPRDYLDYLQTFELAVDERVSDPSNS